MMPLLSIIIPTKNRQYTCLYAIESAVNINSNDIEIIIHDCSDSDVLYGQIKEKFGSDERIKYFHTTTNPSMTENWNMAFSYATGEYLCAIGDDDAVLPEIYKIAKWAKRNSIETVGHTRQFAVYAYKWPDFEDENLKSKLVITRSFDGSVIRNVDTKAILNDKVSKRITLDYFELPMVYHSLVHRDLVERTRSQTGHFLDGTSFDVYSAYVFSLLTNSYASINYPFTIYGACGKSNTNRAKNGKVVEHFKEFKHLNYPAFIPQVFNLQTSIAESMYCAFKNLGRQDLIANIDLPFLYAFCAIEGRKEFALTMQCMVRNKLPISVWVKFLLFFSVKLVKKLVRFCIGNKRADKRYESAEQRLITCNTIADAVQFHKKNNKVKLFSNENEYSFETF